MPKKKVVKLAPPKKRKKSLFYYCFPCIRRLDIEYDETSNQFGSEFTDYEYVIENLAIRRAPKFLLDQEQSVYIRKKKQPKQPKRPKSPKPPKPPKIKHTQTKKPKVKDFGAVVEKAHPWDVIGPVAKVDEYGDTSDCCPCPRGQTKTLTEKGKDDVLRKILIPPCHVFRVEHPSPRIQKISAEVHKNRTDSPPRRLPNIPTEIKETIDALKVAKPPVTSTLFRRNRKDLVRSVSDTSCDKETFCDLLDPEIKNMETKEVMRSSLLDVFSMQKNRKNVTKFHQTRKLLPLSKLTEPSAPLGKNTNTNEEEFGAKTLTKKIEKIVDQNRKTVSKERVVEQDKNKNMKWKIVINKHKGVTSSSEEK